MPTLIRLVIVLIFLGGLAFGGMLALTAVVDPGEKEFRYRIPTRDLMAGAENSPADLREQLPVARVSEPEAGATPVPEGPSAPTAPSSSNQSAPDMSTFE